MTTSYSLRTLEQNKSANQSKIGVKLGGVCIANGISAYDVAKKFGVSKQTVYSWFFGVHEMNDSMADIAKAYIQTLNPENQNA